MEIARNTDNSLDAIETVLYSPANAVVPCTPFAEGIAERRPIPRLKVAIHKQEPYLHNERA
jgi:hypothetical protein